jgi:hypothetical protein
LAALFSLDSFGGGFFVQSLLAPWLFDHFGLSLTAAGSLFFWSGLLSASSYPVAVRLARRIGLVNTMVFTGDDPAYNEYRRAQNVAKYGEAKTREFDEYLKLTSAYMTGCSNKENLLNYARKKRTPNIVTR